MNTEEIERVKSRIVKKPEACEDYHNAWGICAKCGHEKSAHIPHSERQAILQLESIKEMVAGLSREGAIANYVKELSADQCKLLLLQYYENEEMFDGATATIEELRQEVSDKMESEEIEPDDFEFEDDEARQAIQEDALSVEVRSGWVAPGEEMKAGEFCILLCTGGPACRIIGELDQYGQPDRARLEHQNWGTPWTEYLTTGEDNDALLTYCQQFYFGEQ